MIVFLDTEYTGLAQLSPKLISLAMVSEDGRREFYTELEDTWNLEDCSEFVRRNVLPLLSGPTVPLTQARKNIMSWFAESPREVRIACDSVTDYRFLLQLLGGARPSNLAPVPFDLRPLIDTSLYHKAVLQYYESDGREHHALVDARAYRKGWLAWMDARKSMKKHL